MEGGGDSDKSGHKRNNKKWSNSGHSLKMGQTEFSEEPNAWCVRKREIKCDSMILDLSKWKDETAIN